MKKYEKKVKAWVYGEPFEGKEWGYKLKARGVSVSREDMDEINGGGPYGMIMQNPDNPSDRWYVNHKYFKENYQEVKE